MSAWKIIKLLRMQLFLVAFLVALSLLSALKIIPSAVEMSLMLQKLFRSYGLVAVGMISFIENIVGMNAYFPGSIVILFAMSMTAGDLKMALLTFLVIYLPSVLAHNINYLLGRLGSKKIVLDANNSAALNNLNNKNNISYIYFVTFWHPHFTALSCLASGSEGLPYRKFISRFLIISIFWNSFWGVLMYNIGGLSGKEFNFVPIMIGYIVLWGGYDYWKYRRIVVDDAITQCSSKEQ